VTGDELLTPTEARLLVAIKSKPDATSSDLASELKLSERHVRRLMGRERVRKALDAAARAGLASASSVLGRNAQRAAEALSSMATGTSKATTPRVQACRAVLDGAGRLIDLVALEDRIARLEGRDEPAGGLQ